MRGIFLLCAACILVSACGIKRPLIKPADIPAHEAEQNKNRKEREDFRRENNL